MWLQIIWILQCHSIFAQFLSKVLDSDAVSIVLTGCYKVYKWYKYILYIF